MSSALPTPPSTPDPAPKRKSRARKAGPGSVTPTPAPTPAPSGFVAGFNSFAKTFWGKVTLSAARAFIGVFVAAESQLFDAVVQLVTKHGTADFNVLKSLVVALAASAVTAAVRAVQHFFFDKKAPVVTP